MARAAPVFAGTPAPTRVAQAPGKQVGVFHDEQGEDVYIDKGAIKLGIESAVDATGATFENLQLGGEATVQVTDTIDEVVAKLTATRMTSTTTVRPSASPSRTPRAATSSN
nr:immunoglobulin-like domain-containing protein [Pseudomonas putida]